ncbi:MAG: hypothetical protein LBE84_03390, partial [Planctomycetota bacterium]|nr:hypothetical protein [Planctomycetota bacterium]
GNIRSDTSSASIKIRRTRLPKDLQADLAAKLEQAWRHLRSNELNEATALAQEVVWEQPDLVAAKLVIARCFIVRQQYDKGLAILSAINEADRDAETLYYIGLCQTRTGKTREAIEILRKSRSLSTDTLIRRRASDLLESLQGKQAVCPLCGTRHSFDAMVEVGDRLLCSACAKKTWEEEEEPEEEEAYPGLENKGRKRLKRPLTVTEKVIRGVFCLFLVSILFGGVYFLYLLAPEHYAWLRNSIPYSDAILPPPPFMPPSSPGRSQPMSPRVIPSLAFKSRPVRKAIVGVPVRIALEIEGMNARAGTFKAGMTPNPAVPFQLDAKTNVFSWTPAPDDAGKEFTLSFGADFQNARAKEQISRFTVSSGPVFKKIGSWENGEPSGAEFLAATDLNGNGKPDLALVSGNYSQSEIAIFTQTGNESLIETARLPISGRSAGAGAIAADTERWLAVADYWSSRIRFFAFRENVLSEMAVNIDLPGRPLLAGFNTEEATIAVVCRTDDGGTRLFFFRQKGQRDNELLGEWELPENFLWRRVIVLPTAIRNTPAVIVAGSDSANSIFLAESGNAQRTLLSRPDMNGPLIDIAARPDYKSLICLWDKGNRRFVGSLEFQDSTKPAASRANRSPQPASTPPPQTGAPSLQPQANRNAFRRPAASAQQTGRNQPSVPAAQSYTVSGGPLICGFTVIGAPEANPDVLLLGTARVGVIFDFESGGKGETYFWPLPEPARLLGNIVELSRPNAANPVAVFIDEAGGLWSMTLSEERPAKGGGNGVG